jgi:N-acyl-phosphatidylethanolamine-hydrolysing phospholipase D
VKRHAAGHVSALFIVTVAMGFVPRAFAEASDKAHHTPEGFRNLYVEPKKTGFFGFMRMRYFGDDEWSDYQGQGHRVPKTRPSYAWIYAKTPQPRATWLGHSTVLVQLGGINILTDPQFSERASPVGFAGPRRVTKPAIALDKLPRIDLVIISHNHYDHLDAWTVSELGNRVTWLVPLGYKAWFAERGITKVMEFDWWDSATVSGAKVTALPSQHWTGRSLSDRYQALWASWALELAGKSIWFGGDTGYNPHQFKEIGERLGPFDFAMIPIGAYDPRWFMSDMHVNPEEAVQIHDDIRSRFSIGIHWGTFPLTAEPIDEPPKRLDAAAKRLRDSRFVALRLGETVLLDAPAKDTGLARQADRDSACDASKAAC